VGGAWATRRHIRRIRTVASAHDDGHDYHPNDPAAGLLDYYKYLDKSMEKSMD